MARSFGLKEARDEFTRGALDDRISKGFDFSQSVGTDIRIAAKLGGKGSPIRSMKTLPSVTVALVPFGRRPVSDVPGGLRCPPLGVVGVGHRGEVDPVSFVRRPDARSRKRDCPAGVVFTFQVSLNKVEPSKSVLTRNLLTKDDFRLSEAREV